MMLVEFFDRLLDILDTEPRYKSYLLDSQVVPVEDYLEVRPEQRNRISDHVSTGRLLIGPWYTCPEEFCVNGESLVRNLLYGNKVAGEFGGAMKVGYSPFSYGQTSQMPQIYGGFGIDTNLFYHGVSHDEVPNEFMVEGPDGSRLFGSQMSSKARYNFYFYLYRPVVYGKTIDERTYEWQAGGLPFHFCDQERCTGHHFLADPVKHFHQSKIGPCVKDLREKEAAVATTKYLAYMQGHDSSGADLLELKAIDAAQKFLGNDTMVHSSLPEYIAKVKKAARNLTVLSGERRTPSPMGPRLHLFGEVTSGRVRMKRLNALTEHVLQRWAEPWSSISWYLGDEYPASLLEIAWKYLLKCHAHDSIAGSGVDQIEKDVVHRLEQANNIADALTGRALQQVQVRIDNSDAGPDDVLLTIFNPSPFPRSEVLTATVDLPDSCGYKEFSISDTKGGAVPTQLVTRRPHNAVVRHLDDATMEMPAEQVTFHLETRDVPSMGYTTYKLEHEDDLSITKDMLVTGRNSMENEHLAVTVNTDGTLSLCHKDSGVTFDRLHYFEDGGEAGHAWMHIEPAVDKIVTTLDCPVTVALEESGPLVSSYRVEYRMRVPEGLDEAGGDFTKRLEGSGDASRRTAETKELKIVSLIRLRRGSRCVEVTTRFDNRCRNHRLRVMFPTHIKATYSAAEMAFDVVEREIDREPDSPWFAASNPTHPQHRFVDVSDGVVGMAIINDGVREYEVTDDDERTIALTLLRAYEVSLTTVSKRWERHPEMMLSQTQGIHEFRYLIYPHSGTWDQAGVYAEAERLTVPMRVAQVGPHGGDMPKHQSFMSIKPANLVLSALKQSEDGQSLVLRLFNPTKQELPAEIRFSKKIRIAALTNLNEETAEGLRSKGKTLRFPVGHKKIVTVHVTFQGR